MNWSEYFHLDRTSGVLTWRERPRHHFRTQRGMNQTNAREAGTVVGTDNGDGYLQVRIRPKAYYVHRIVWQMCNGDIPNGMEIDHANGNKSDNRPSNLRLATETQNKWNKPGRPNKTGYKGVYKHASGKYGARIGCDKKIHSLGLHDTPERAHLAYMEAAVKMHGQFAHA